MRQYQIVLGSSEGYGLDRLSPGVFRSPHFAILRQVKGRSSAVSRRSSYGKCLGPEEGIYGREFPLPSLMFSDRFLTLGTNLDGSLPFGDDRPVATLQTRRSTPRLHPSPPRLNFLLLLSIPFGNITNRCTGSAPVSPWVNKAPTGELNRYGWPLLRTAIPKQKLRP